MRLALARLRHADREVLILHHLGSTSIDEVARVLGLRRNAADARLSRARIASPPGKASERSAMTDRCCDPVVIADLERAASARLGSALRSPIFAGNLCRILSVSPDTITAQRAAILLAQERLR